jgi:hypothetical protein
MALFIRGIGTKKVTNHAIPTRVSRCEVSKLLHHSKFGKKGLCPQITQMHADEELFFFLSASICVHLRAIPDSVAALPPCVLLWPQNQRLLQPIHHSMTPPLHHSSP